MADGFDASAPAADKGSALKAVREFVEANGVAHADYQPFPNEWYDLGNAVGGAANAGRNHFLYNITWEEWTATNGSARWVSVLLSYTRNKTEQLQDASTALRRL